MAFGIKWSVAKDGSARALNGRRETDETDCMMSIVALLVVLVFPGNALAAPSNTADAREIDERALLNWATHLSRYPTDDHLPQIRYESHEFFVDNACLGREDCQVLGWYDDQDIVYIDESLDAMDSLFERSLLVHELVHVLQHRSGDYDEQDCIGFVEREREAYAVQQSFYVARGAVPVVRPRHYTRTKTTPELSAAVEEAGDSYARQAFIDTSARVEASANNPSCVEDGEICPRGKSTSTNQPGGTVK